MFHTAKALAAAAFALAAGGAAAQEPPSMAHDMSARVAQVSVHMGEMSVSMGPRGPRQVGDTLRFEPYQMLDELFRPDIVFLMRHGPTDWSFRDRKDVAPDDCENQRILSPQGRENMVDKGILLAANELRPSKIVVSQWCRNQQTLEAMMEGFRMVDPLYADAVEVVTDPALNLLLSLQGAPNVTEMREMVSSWDPGDRAGPLLLLTHYTNIEEMTDFRVYEGEMLMVDPKRENRVVAYVRLRSAAPDVGHFNTSADESR